MDASSEAAEQIVRMTLEGTEVALRDSQQYRRGLQALPDVDAPAPGLLDNVVITGGSLSVLNDTVMSGSLYYKVFNLFNPFL